MSKASVFDPAWIDLVFEGRNQNYGAYRLRREDNKTTILALITGIALVGALISIPALSNYFSDNSTAAVAEAQPLDKPIVVHEIYNLPKAPEPEPVQPKGDEANTAPAPAPRPTQPTTQYTNLHITQNPVDITTTMTDIYTTNPGTTTDPGKGIDDIDLGTPTGTTPGGQGTSTTGVPDGNEVYNSVDVMPQFPGGMEHFYKEVGKRFNTPETSSAMTLKVYVSFVVEPDGSMTNIIVGRNPGYGMAEEAIRVLKSIKTKWHPGIKNGRKVRTAYSLPITINVK